MLLAGGMLATLVVALAIFWSGGPPAVAQPQAAPAAAPGRYQISSFVLPRVDTPGAYILDTQTGEVFQVVGKDEPVRIGSVAKAAPKK